MQSLRSSLRSGWRLLGCKRKGLGMHLAGHTERLPVDVELQESNHLFWMVRKICTDSFSGTRVQCSAQSWKPLLPLGCRCMSTDEGSNDEGGVEESSKEPREKKKRLKKKDKYGTYDKGFEYDLANLEAMEVSQPLYNARAIVDRWIEEQDDTPFKDLLTRKEVEEAGSRFPPSQAILEGPKFDAMATEFHKWQEEMLEKSGDFDEVLKDFDKFAARMVDEHGESGRVWGAEIARQFEEQKKLMKEVEGNREVMEKLEEEMKQARQQEEEESKGPRLRWETRVVLDPGAAWHPANRKVKMSVYVWELVRDCPLDDTQREHLIALVGRRYNPNKDEITITSERYRYREENRKDCLRILYALLDEAKQPLVEAVESQG